MSNCHTQNEANNKNGLTSKKEEDVQSKHRRDLFGDCALIEIIHLHDCFRGALKALEADVSLLVRSITESDPTSISSKLNGAYGKSSPSVSDVNHQCEMKVAPFAASDNLSSKNVDRTESSSFFDGKNMVSTIDLERRVSGRFKVIWTVFKSHSHAEDEFIWPALKTKTFGRILHSYGEENETILIEPVSTHQHANDPQRSDSEQNVAVQMVPAAQDGAVNDENQKFSSGSNAVVIEQEEYEEDHADEERMFSQMDALLTKIRDAILSEKQKQEPHRKNDSSSNILNRSIPAQPVVSYNTNTICSLVNALLEHTQLLSRHLMTHLQKEETQCMPLVLEHLSKEEIHELVGQIMGQRSADTIAQIMTMAVQNLIPHDRDEMVKYMKQSMAGTFFDRWLLMSGWMKDIDTSSTNRVTNDSESNDSTTPEPMSSHFLDDDMGQNMSSSEALRKHHDHIDEHFTPIESSDNMFGTNDTTLKLTQQNDSVYRKRAASSEFGTKTQDLDITATTDTKHLKSSRDEDDASTTCAHNSCFAVSTLEAMSSHDDGNKPSGTACMTTQSELEKLIRAIATNQSLTPAQKNTTIQGLRDSVWKNNQRLKESRMEPPTMVNQKTPGLTIPFASTYQQQQIPGQSVQDATASTTNNNNCRMRRATPPSAYFRKNKDGKLETVWTGLTCTSDRDSVVVPLFSAGELAPTFHDGAAGAVLGCPHYARACKLRHPKSGRLYTCRLCCEQERELPMRDQDVALDRYAVTEVMCMKCNALQPAEDRCINPDCESHGKPFSKYFCRICHLYDDGSRPIFHCPYCNTCRLGLGLGIDYRHCMRCNACVALSDKDHRCIPQKLQGNCPICHESLFLSTDPLRGLKCGHVLHLSCFVEYRRDLNYTCPLCMKSMEDMKDYFALLDTAVRMQPMPAGYLHTSSNIYCQDCNKTGRVPYHFVGLKCSDCGSYNTRELGRVHASPVST